VRRRWIVVRRVNTTHSAQNLSSSQTSKASQQDSIVLLGAQYSMLWWAEGRTLGTLRSSMQLDIASFDGLIALIAVDKLERTGRIMRLEIALIDAELACPVASDLVLAALDSQAPYHRLHKAVSL
jgi:hypothetical protein